MKPFIFMGYVIIGWLVIMVVLYINHRSNLDSITEHVDLDTDYKPEYYNITPLSELARRQGLDNVDDDLGIFDLGNEGAIYFDGSDFLISSTVSMTWERQ